MANNENPGRYEVTDEQISSVMDRAQRSFPAIVVSYDAATLRAEVQPAIRIRSKGAKQTTPKVVVIPVAWPSWGEYGVQGKLAPGDEVLVECMDRNWLAWLKAGGVADYNAIGGRQAGYAVAKPVQVSDVRRPDPLGAGEAVKIGKRDGSSTVVLMDDGQVRIQSSDVRLGASAGAPLAVARDTDTVNTNAAHTTWRTNVEAGVLAGGGGVVPPLAGTATGTVAASSTEVTST